MVRTYWLETLGCPKNQVDSDKLEGTLQADGLRLAVGPEYADVIVVNTCAFIGDARQESVDTIIDLDERRRSGAELVVTGCLAERYGQEISDAVPGVDKVAPFGVPVSIGPRPGAEGITAMRPAFDLLNLPRPPVRGPWAYVKVAEGCDRACGFCAIPSFRGPQRSRSLEAIVAEVSSLGPAVREVVLVAQDLAAYGRDQGQGQRSIVALMEAVGAQVDWVRLLYLYPSDLTDVLVNAICATDVAYFDLSLQHVSRPLLRRMRRWGDGARFAQRISDIRSRRSDAVFRSNFIVGYPGETEDDHGELLGFVEDAQLDWCGFFAFSPEEGTHAFDLDGAVPEPLVSDRLAELRELQDGITAAKRDALIGQQITVLVDTPGVARSFREAPEIDGVIEVPPELAVGSFATVRVVDALGTDLVARP